MKTLIVLLALEAAVCAYALMHPATSREELNLTVGLMLLIAFAMAANFCRRSF